MPNWQIFGPAVVVNLPQTGTAAPLRAPLQSPAPFYDLSGVTGMLVFVDSKAILGYRMTDQRVPSKSNLMVATERRSAFLLGSIARPW